MGTGRPLRGYCTSLLQDDNGLCQSCNSELAERSEDSNKMYLGAKRVGIKVILLS